MTKEEPKTAIEKIEWLESQMNIGRFHCVEEWENDDLSTLLGQIKNGILALENLISYYEKSQLKPQEGESEDKTKIQRLCTCHLRIYSEYTPLEKEYGCYNCGGKANPKRDNPLIQTPMKEKEKARELIK